MIKKIVTFLKGAADVVIILQAVLAAFEAFNAKLSASGKFDDPVADSDK